MEINLKDIRGFGNLELLARQLVEGFITGMHKSPYHGFSVEFAEHRLYNTGESTRHIDWKVFAKTDRLHTKRYEEETNLRCQIVIDNSKSMYYPVENKGKITFSIMAAASLCYLLHKQRDAFGLSVFTDEINYKSEIKSTSAHLNKILIYLQNLLNEEVQSHGTNIAEVLHEIAKKTHKRSLVVIFTDMFETHRNVDEVFAALQHLKHNKHEVLLFHIADKATEYNFEFADRPHEFIDLESGEKLKLQPSQIKQHFHTEAEEFFNKLKLKCAQLKIDLIETDIKEDYRKMLSSYLIKRTKMK